VALVASCDCGCLRCQRAAMFAAGRTPGCHCRHSGRRPDWDATVAMLRSYGADLVTTEARLKQDLAAAGLPLPALALNCVGGSSAAAIAKVLRRVLLPLPPLDSCQQLIMPLSCSADGW